MAAGRDVIQGHKLGAGMETPAQLRQPLKRRFQHGGVLLTSSLSLPSVVLPLLLPPLCLCCSSGLLFSLLLGAELDAAAGGRHHQRAVRAQPQAAQPRARLQRFLLVREAKQRPAVGAAPLVSGPPFRVRRQIREARDITLNSAPGTSCLEQRRLHFFLLNVPVQPSDVQPAVVSWSNRRVRDPMLAAAAVNCHARHSVVTRRQAASQCLRRQASSAAMAPRRRVELAVRSHVSRTCARTLRTSARNAARQHPGG